MICTKQALSYTFTVLKPRQTFTGIFVLNNWDSNTEIIYI